MSPAISRAVVIVAAAVLLLGGSPLAQTKKDEGGFSVRELSVSSGYAFVQLPPITLGGFMPQEAVQQDLVTSGTAAIDWSRITPRTLYSLNLFGTYTARTKYSQLNSPGANLTFGVTRALGRRWRLGAGVASGITMSDQLASQPVSGRRLIDDAASFEDLAGTVAVVRSPNPDLAQAALFVPISESFDSSEINGTRSVVGSGKVAASYVHSVRLATHVHAAYTTVRAISSRDDDASALTAVDANARSAGVGIKYGPSERSQVTADLSWSQTDGVATDKVASATIGYGWTGRKWLGRASVGVGVRPFRLAEGAAEPISSGTPVPIYSAAVGYKFQTQTVLVQYSRAPHDEYGHGGRNTTTGFTGDVQSVTGSWSWVPPRGRWTARSDFSLTRRPGNFSYTYAWLATAGVGRQIGPNLRVMGEVLFDRHGSRAFEGFHLMRQGVRLNVIWSPSRRRIESEPVGQ